MNEIAFPLKSNFEGSRLLFFDEKSSSRSLGDFFGAHRSLNRESILDFILFGTIVPPYSPLTGVRHLFPGETIDGSGASSEYCALDLEFKRQDIRGFVEDFDALLQTYFERNPVSEPALLLSGGIDSAIIASYLGKKTACITWGGWGEDTSDVVFAKETAKEFGIRDHHFVYVDYERDNELYQRIVRKLKIPLLFHDAVPHMRMAEKAKELGIANWFMGQNADTVLVSYPAPIFVRRLVMANRFLPANSFFFLRDRRKYLFSTASIVRLFAYFKSQGIFPGPWITVPEEYFRSKEECIAPYISARDLMQRIILTEELLTESRRNQISQNEIPAIFGIDVKCPYYSKEFVNLALRIPMNLRKLDGYDKAVFKELARKRGVPAAVVEKKKKGLSYGYREFMRAGMHIPIWDKMERDDFTNAFVRIKKIREKRENDFFTFDCLRSVYEWGELVAKPHGFSITS